MSRVRLGIAIGAKEIRAMMVESGVVLWHGGEPLAGIGSLPESLTKVLMRAPTKPKASWVGVVVSPAWVQVKQLHGLPAIKSRLANELVRENLPAFFLWKGSQSVVPDIHIYAGGAAWGAAFDKDVVEAVAPVLRSRRLNIEHIGAAVVAIVAVIPNRPIVWYDGDEWFELEGDARGVRRIERRSTDAVAEQSALPAPLTGMGVDALRFVDAYAAAVAPRRIALSWRVPSDEQRSRTWSRVRRGAGGFALVATIAFALFGPGLRAAGFTRDAERELARQKRARTELARGEAELRRVTQVLNRVESFRAERGWVTRLLGQISQAIPESTAMLTFHIDTAEGGFTAIAPHVADVLPELTSIDQIVAPRIIGSVTRETLGGVRVERAAFRFRRSRLKPEMAPTRGVVR